MLHSEYELAHHHQIAVNERYICYGLKQGHIRVLCRTSADRHLCKGHTLPISDMRWVVGHIKGRAFLMQQAILGLLLAGSLSD